MSFRAQYDPPRDPESISPAVGHPKTNRTLVGPPDSGVGDLECEIFRDEYERPSGKGTYSTMGTRSRFIPSPEQVRKLQEGGHLLLEVMQHPTPPVWVGVEGPPCPFCSEEMQWDERMQTFGCANYAAHQDDDPSSPQDEEDEMGSAVPESG